MAINNPPLIFIRGGGDLATGAALRLHHVGFPVVILELASPTSVRRSVCFSEAVYEREHTVEDVTSRLVSADQLQVTLEAGEIPVLVDPNADVLRNQFLTSPQSTFLVDARLMKTKPESLPIQLPLHIGLGPGFSAGENCHAVIETRRSHTLGRVYWEGSAQADSGQPEGDPRRVLRAPANGFVNPLKKIGEYCTEGEKIAVVHKKPVLSPFDGVLRGLMHPRVEVTKDMKIGDIDPHNDASVCSLVSDKALAVGGGVLEAVLVKLREWE
ncbi:MAG: selenium-dependent molybdenum cofactor biosynthesis protein YqeB [Anaerolineales bacterium]|nr:selenium-dependent molybdenum cofactor biosynthesis protein YqeB [Anaerolineales bacterium]